MEPSITVTLAGGLGNQLFQWATGYAVAQRLNANLELDQRKIFRRDKSLDARSYQLNYFSISDRQSPILKATMRKPIFRRIFSKSANQSFQESGFRFDERIESVVPGTTLTGHFQSWRYFSDYESAVRRALTHGAKPSSECLSLLHELSGKRWIGVHVRRGDYKNFPEVFTLLDSDYYARALSLVDLSHAEEVVVFSEDIADARGLVPQGTIYADRSRISQAGDVVMLLSHASHIVGANSSLSWWGAYLNDGPGTVKVFPARWFGPKGWPVNDLIPEGWHVV